MLAGSFPARFAALNCPAAARPACLPADDLNRGLGTRFRHNTLSAVLLQSHPNSVWPMLMHSAREGWAAWGALSQGIQSGQVPFQVST